MQYKGDFSLKDLTEFMPRTITQIYGPPASGKTNLCMIAALKVVDKGKKVLFIDTEGSFSTERLKQLTDKDAEEVLKQIIIAEPNDFDEQKIAINKAEEIVMKENIGLIIVDSFIALYRLEMNNTEPYALNRELGRQLSVLLKISKRYRIPAVITNQVYTVFDKGEDTKPKMKPVGRDVLKYWTKVIIALEKEDSGRSATLIRHKFKKDGLRIPLTIAAGGIE